MIFYSLYVGLSHETCIVIIVHRETTGGRIDLGNCDIHTFYIEIDEIGRAVHMVGLKDFSFGTILIKESGNKEVHGFLCVILAIICFRSPLCMM